MTLSRVLGGLQRRLRRWKDGIAARRYFDGPSLGRIHDENHRVISSVRSWVSDETLDHSVFRYGIPDEIRRHIDLDTGSGISYTDALVHLARTLEKPVRYLEIGVSVGKNFLPMTQQVRSGRLVAFDIEEMTPLLRERLAPQSRVTWPTQAGSLKINDSSLTECASSGSSASISYLCGDVFDEASWARLDGERFNMVFSDAFHSGEALMHEHEMLLKHGLLDDDELVMAWDDLGGEMTAAFDEICRRLRRVRRGARSDHFIAPFKGWLGDNWGAHEVGFFISRRA